MIQTLFDQNLWSSRNFLRLWFMTVLPTLGDSAYFIILVWLANNASASKALLGIVLMCASIPRLVLMAVGGVVADRFSRKHILMFSVAVRGLLLLLLGLYLHISDGHSLFYVLCVVSFLFGCVDAFYWPARGAITPQALPKEQLPVANSILDSSMQFSNVIGTSFGALLMLLPSYSAMFFAVSIWFLISAIPILGLQLQPHVQQEVASPSKNAFSSAWQDIREGVRYVRSLRILVLILLVSLFMNVFLMGPLNVGLPMFTKQLGWNGSEYASMEVAFGIGAILGGVITAMYKGFRGHYRWLPLSIVVMGLSFAAVFSMKTYGIGLLLLVIGGIAMPIINTPINTYVQTIVEPQMLGRVFSLMAIMSTGLIPVTYGMLTFLINSHLLTPALSFLIGGFGIALLGVLCLLVRDFRQMEEHPAWKMVDDDHPISA